MIRKFWKKLLKALISHTKKVCESDVQSISFYDGTYFKEVSLILHVDDFEICIPLGTPREG